nr:non-ribosomal peptide synthetase 3 [Streptomyces sp.]
MAPREVVLAAFAALLGRYAGTDDVVVTVQAANRAGPGAGDLVGRFATLVSVRVGLAGSPGLAEVVRRVRGSLAAALRQPDVPPPAQPVFALTEPPEAALDLPGVVARPVAGAVRADLPAGFEGHLADLLRAGIADPGRPLDSVGARRPRDGDPGGVHEMFRRHAARSPHAVAVRYGTESVEYGRLDAWSDRIAAALRAEGAGPGKFVAVMLPAGCAQVAAVLGVAKSGAAFVFLDAGDPVARMSAVLADSRPVCVLTTQETAAAQCAPAPLVVLEPCPPGADTPSRSPSPADPRMPLCLAYTSGTTGIPKGIALTHATFAQFAAWQRDHLGIRPGGRIAQWAPITYDAAYTEIFAALCAGATVCVPPEGTRRDPVAMVRWLRAERITQWQTVPAFFGLITEALDVIDPDAAGIPSLEHVLLAGEVLPSGLAAAWAGRAVRPRLHNLYGPTECVLATHRELLPGERFPVSVPVGRAIPGREVLVLDSRLRACPVGVTGEIYLRSDLLAGRYHRRPAETARAYLPDPWRPGGTLYRTGDLGRRLPGGDLEFAGRLGNQVKVRGHRVELEGIEALLESHPSVREAAARVHEHPSGDRRLVAYAVADGQTSGGGLRRYLAGRLPAPTVPDTVVLLDALPRTRTGKRDRARLPRPGHGEV